MTRSSVVPDLEMMALKTRTALPVAALLAVAVLGVSACGGGMPGNSVATVGDQTIKRGTFEHWMRIIAISQAGQGNPAAAKTAKVPDAPDFKQCIADKKKTAAKPAKGQPEPTEAQLKTQCKQSYEQFKTQVLGFLIRSTWLDQEANRLKVKVSEKTITKQIDDIKKQQFAQKGSYEKFLQGAGLTNEDVLYQQRIRELQNKITQKVTKGKDKVTDAQIEAYYNKNKSRFSTPERRDLRIVLTKDKAKAEQAKKALESGQSWKAVAKKYSVDQASKGKGGALPGVAKGQQEPGFDKAIFAADKGKLTGPVKTQFGWYVFEVSKITATKQQTLEESKSSIKQILASQSQQSALKKFGDDYRKRYKKTTDCRKGYVVDDCKNAPKKKATSTTAPAGTSGSGQQQGTTTTTP
jgi:parvulin-like peptidyl-prolyl isomerase